MKIVSFPLDDFEITRNGFFRHIHKFFSDLSTALKQNIGKVLKDKSNH